MNISYFISMYQEQLKRVYSAEESLSILKIVCEDLLGWSRSQFLTRGNEALNSNEKQLLEESLEQLTTSKPIQYITNKAHFYGHVFCVNEHTLIPRQETEELVDLIIKDFKNAKSLSILDIGTGSGCIASSLALTLPKSVVTALDVSQQALDIALQNARLLNAPVNFVKQDILKTNSLEKFDVVVSNPPYVRNLEKKEIHKNVLNHEPHAALFVEDENPLEFYDKILSLCKQNIGTVVYFEINQYLGVQMQELALAFGYQCMLFKDLNGNDRMLKCWQL